VCLIATRAVRSRPGPSDNFAPTSYVGELDPPHGLGIADRRHRRRSFLAAIALWVMSALRKVKRAQLRRNAFVSSALNNLNQGVVMTDRAKRIIFCNDRYLEIYGLARRIFAKT
jgi:PAS domain-containing protein